MDSGFACPHCGSICTVRHGRAKSGRGRRLCRDCGKTFSETTGTVFLSRKMPEGKLRMMINLMLNDTKLKAIADCVGFSSKTAYLWRMKVFAAAFEIQKGVKLSGIVWINEKSVPVNGSAAIRLANEKKMRGVSRKQVCVACAVASNGARYAVIAGKGHITSAECVRTYGAHIAKGLKIVHDGVFSHDRLIAHVGGDENQEGADGSEPGRAAKDGIRNLSRGVISSCPWTGRREIRQAAAIHCLHKLLTALFFLIILPILTILFC